jgi:hypothetical protein
MPWSPTEAKPVAPVVSTTSPAPPPTRDPIVVPTPAAVTVAVAPRQRTRRQRTPRRRPSPKVVGGALVVLEVMALVTAFAVIWHFASRPVIRRASEPSVTTAAKRPAATTVRTSVAIGPVATRSATAPVFVDASGPAIVGVDASGPAPATTVVPSESTSRFDSIRLNGDRVAAVAFDHLKTTDQVRGLYWQLDAFENWLLPPNDAPNGRDLLQALSISLKRSSTQTTVSRSATYFDGSADIAAAEASWKAAVASRPGFPSQETSTTHSGSGPAKVTTLYYDETLDGNATVTIVKASGNGFVVTVRHDEVRQAGSNVTMHAGQLWSLFDHVPHSSSGRISEVHAAWSQNERRLTSSIIVDLPRSVLVSERDKIIEPSAWTGEFRPGVVKAPDPSNWRVSFAGDGTNGAINGTVTGTLREEVEEVTIGMVEQLGPTQGLR